MDQEAGRACLRRVVPPLSPDDCGSASTPCCDAQRARSRRADVVEATAGRCVPATIPGSHEQADDRARQDELNVRREATGAMPAAPAVKELAAVRTQPGKDVLAIGRGSRCGPKRGRIERHMAECEQRQTEEAAANLEATIGDVLMRHPITGQVQRRTEGEGGEPRACQRTQRSTPSRHGERRSRVVRSGPAPSPLFAVLRRVPGR